MKIGITLVALIITVIILIILAAVTINSLTLDGLADMAVKSSQDYQIEQTNEIEKLNEIYSLVEETIKNLDNEIFTPKPDTPITPTPDFSETIELVNSNIGASIDYTPLSDKTYSTTIDDIEYSGYGNQDFSTSDLTGGWKIWGIEDTHICLVSENSTDKALTLSGVRGYNNGVTLLDNICKSCYGNTNYNDLEARSMKLSDILEVSTITNIYASQYGTTPYSYSFKYPYIWDQYEKTVGTDITKRETAYDLDTQDAISSIVSYSPTYTLWGANNMHTSTYKTPYGEKYKTMILEPASSTDYWLSSRYVDSRSINACYFGLQYMQSTKVSRANIYYCYNESPHSLSYSAAVRPLVSIPLSSCILTQNKDGTFHIAPRA